MAQRGTLFIDRLNIAMMLAALIPALLLPFELFLFVYAFIGPLHYLTEINWLHKKQYFTNHRYDYLLLAGIIFAVAVLVYSHSVYAYLIPILIFTALFGALGTVLLKSKIAKGLFIAGAAIAGCLLYYFFKGHFRIVFSILLPTIVHVFIFTGLFILYGVLKSKSRTGIASVFIFIGCAVITLAVSPSMSMINISEGLYNNYGSFTKLNRVLIRTLDFIHANDAKTFISDDAPYINAGDTAVFSSGNGTRIIRFIAFAYTYHYLNWFSKTSVIQWHATKLRNLIIISVIWIASIALYIYDFKAGLKWLYLLSFGHVVLEFPLNFRSLIAIHGHFKIPLLKNTIK